MKTLANYCIKWYYIEDKKRGELYMKKKLLVFSLIALLALTITSCAKKSFSVTINLEEGEEIVGIA